MAKVGERELGGTDITELTDMPVVTVGKSYEAVITRLIRTTAGEIFGAGVRALEGQTQEQAASRPVLWVGFEGAGFIGNAVLSIPTRVAGPSSNLGKFAKRYGALPKVGMKVSAHLVADGDNTYARLDL